MKMSLSTVSSVCGLLMASPNAGTPKSPDRVFGTCATKRQTTLSDPWRCSPSRTGTRLVEEQRRSVAMLAPAAPALNRDETLELLASAEYRTTVRTPGRGEMGGGRLRNTTGSLALRMEHLSHAARSVAGCPSSPHARAAPLPTAPCHRAGR